jgi:hydrogenase maturation protease
VKIRVIGVGTRRGDDAAGLETLERLARAPLPGNVELVACERPSPELVDLLSGADVAVVIDALEPAGTPGRVLRVDPAALRPAGGLSTHALGVAEALALAEALGRGPGRLELVGIEAGEGDAGLSEPVQRSVEETAVWVGAWVTGLARET